MKKKIRVPIMLDDEIYNSISEYARVNNIKFTDLLAEIINKHAMYVIGSR